MRTFAVILDRAGVSVPDVDLADIEVPVLSGVQRQGDVLVIPKALTDKQSALLKPVPLEGIAVVRGEATGNTHLLHGEGDVTWAPITDPRDPNAVLLGVLKVAKRAVAWLIHTDEHGVTGIGPGSYVLHGKREQADLIRRVAD